ncbi:MAG: flagellar basal-body rod protein FlgF [Lachnospiraceae bacterium]|nr:flagellar basal-body rod protein FlgF [Lachnospiraceae bacterium]
MVKGLYTAYTGLLNEQRRMDVITNNLANSATTGYKKEGATSQAFDEVLAYKIKDNLDAPFVSRRLGGISMGVKMGETYTDYSQGAMRDTGNTFDIAISGSGFFTVDFTNKAGVESTKYTRDGSFTLTKEGYLVTKDGDFVQGTQGDIRVDPLEETSIDDMGNIYQNGQIVATILITDFEDYNYLEHYGENYYQPVEGAQEREPDALLLSGYLEASNVQVVSEMVDMIAISRAYETNQKIVQTYDSSLQIAANDLGKV